MKRRSFLCVLSVACLLGASTRSIACEGGSREGEAWQGGPLEDMDYRPESDRPVDEGKSSSHRVELVLGMVFIGGLLLLALFRQQARFSRRRMR